jgi:5-methyltetrahydrofolate--homocysteine methyltransferase
MTRTVLESKTKTVVIGFDEPFCVIGERINPTGRKKLAAELEAGNFETVIKDALEQVACGATVLDINSGAVFTNKMAEDPRYADNNFVEPPLMKQLIEIVQQTVEVPLCIDSSVPGALEAGLMACEGRPLLNSVTGEEERLELVLPLVKKYNVPVVAISNDDTGISPDPDVRFAVAKKIVQRAADFGIPAHDIVVDPLVMPVGAMASRRSAGLRPGAPPARGTGREHHLRRVEHLVRPAASPRHQRRLPADGDRRRHDQRDHEPGAPAGDGGDPRRQLPDEPRCQRRRMDPLCQGAGSGRGGATFAEASAAASQAAGGRRGGRRGRG